MATQRQQPHLRGAFEQLDENAARTDQHDRPENRIAFHADENLDSAAHHLLNEHAVDQCVWRSDSDARRETLESLSYIVLMRQTERQSADVGFVHEIG